jgi:hypothetical protein
MSCSSPERELVTFWVAGTLEPAEAELVSRHVESCAGCRADAVESAALVDGLGALHLTAGEIVEAAAGDLASPHLLVCSRCRDEVALLRDVNADLAKPASTTPWRWRATGLALAAAAAVFLVVWIAPRRAVDRTATLRGGESTTVTLLAAAPGADGVPVFSWTPFPSATRYRVDLFSGDGLLIWAREVDGPPARWPDAVPRAPGSYRWRVEALAAGVSVARSQLAAFEIAR